MMEMTGEHFKMSHDRLQELMAQEEVNAAGLSVARVREICLARSWPDPTVHQGWLDEAKIGEIAHWVCFVDKQESRRD
ncbi:MAG TPA: hypothetical protein VHS06_10645 [Chloroflexota bacterium]|nr:hypothetical protein [Chloroflexota bacterium]